ncbi:MAG: galactosyldiacylglycerol synthase, partial [Burkholderiales bacterium]|nr:galactosyldiacylglycerol synthase [Burkholderiales bacterium]
RVHRSSGMILRPDFYRAPQTDRAAERRAQGFDDERPVGVVLFGGHGSKVMKRIARELPDTPLILLCGHNDALAKSLRALPAAAPRLVVGHTEEVARYLRMGDFFIGKPGPGSVSEALHCGLPVIVTRNTWTMPQERYNTDWVREQGVGLVLPGFNTLADAVPKLIAQLPQLRERVHRLDNRAVFEVPELLARLLAARVRPRSQEIREAVTAMS